jgi:hypothetical protein
MNKSSSIPAASTAAPKENIARSYLELQRLRQLVQEAERPLTSQGVNVTPSGSRITPPGADIKLTSEFGGLVLSDDDSFP